MRLPIVDPAPASARRTTVRPTATTPPPRLRVVHAVTPVGRRRALGALWGTVIGGHGHAHLGTTRSRPFGERLTRIAFSERHHQGAEIVIRPAGGAIPDDRDLLFVIRADRLLVPVTEHQRPAPKQGDTLVLLGPARRAVPLS